MEGRLARPAYAAPGQALEQQVLVDQKHEDLRHRPVEPVQRLVERFSLGDGAGEAVHQEALGRVGLLQAVLDDADHHAVGHQLARVHELLGLQAHLGLVLDGRAQDVARRDMGDAVLGHDAAGLGALAGAGGPQKDEVELSHA